MTARARRRPAGKQAATKAATKRVEPAPPSPGHRAEPTNDTGRPTGKDLDERERRQSTKRKPKGPARSPVTDDDVLIKKPARIAKQASTAEVPPNDPR